MTKVWRKVDVLSQLRVAGAWDVMQGCVITQKHKPFSEDKFGISPVNVLVGIETWYNILTTLAGKYYTETPIS